SSGMRALTQSASCEKCGCRVDCCHQGSFDNGVACRNNTMKVTATAPRSKPKNIPKNRSVPVNPVPAMILPNKKLIKPPTIKAVKNNATKAIKCLAEGNSI